MKNEEDDIDYLLADPLNKTRRRNGRNTNRLLYNCGGLALNVYNWVVPYSSEDGDYYFDDDYTQEERLERIRNLYKLNLTDEEVASVIAEYDSEFLLRHYPFLKRIDISNAKDAKRVIAYRVYTNPLPAIDDDWDEITTDSDNPDTDFHFKVRINGFWFEKSGAGKPKLCELKPNEPWVNDECKYCSNIIYFIDEREENNG